MDVAIDYWGSPGISHPIVSFQFTDALPLCFSIETRKTIGQTYSALRGLYRQYTRIYIVADERDSLRVRTNDRQGEDVYLCHTLASPAQGPTRRGSRPGFFLADPRRWVPHNDQRTWLEGHPRVDIRL